MAEIERAAKTGTKFYKHHIERGRPAVYPTGYPQLDWVLGGGHHAGEMTLVGGGTGGGKTILLEHFAINAARAGVRVAFCSLEFPMPKIAARILAKMHSTTIAGFLDDLDHDVAEYQDNAFDTIGRLDELPLWILTPAHGEEWGARRCFEESWKRAHAQLIIIDHAQELAGWNDGIKDGQHWPRIISDELSSLTLAAGEKCGISLVIAHQLTLPPNLGQRRPNMAMFADTRRLARKADNVILTHRPFRGEDGESIAEQLVVKNRNGPEGCIHTGFRAMSFPSMSIEDAAKAPCCAPAVEKRRKIAAALAAREERNA